MCLCALGSRLHQTDGATAVRGTMVGCVERRHRRADFGWREGQRLAMPVVVLCRWVFGLCPCVGVCLVGISAESRQKSGAGPTNAYDYGASDAARCSALRASMLGAPIGRALVGLANWPPLGDWVSIRLRLHLFALVFAVFSFLSQINGKTGWWYVPGWCFCAPNPRWNYLSSSNSSGCQWCLSWSASYFIHESNNSGV